MSSIRVAALALFFALTLAACSTAPPEGLRPVTSFDLNRYLGQWYEIARLDHSFERGMSDVSATYQLQEDGSVKVINRGYDTQRQAWKEAIGRALFVGESSTASLKVSFFGPALMTNYWVLDHGDDYDWSIVGEGSGRYLWILTREPRPSAERRVELIARAKSLGYDTDMLRYTEQPAR